MSQTTLTSFFSSRKRPATEEIVSSKNKIAHIERVVDARTGRKSPILNGDLKVKNVKLPSVDKIRVHAETGKKLQPHQPVSDNSSGQTEKIEVSEQCSPVEIVRTDTASKKSDVKDQPSTSKNTGEEVVAFSKKSNAANISINDSKGETLRLAREELSLGDIKKQLSSKGKAKLNVAADQVYKRLQQFYESKEKKNLKEFKSIDVDVTQSPSKKAAIQNELFLPDNKETFKEPPVPLERPLISPRKVFVSPIKSPSKVSAYDKHTSLPSSSSLPLPYHYRLLGEIFHSMEAVVALLYNRNEKITFDKLQPSIQKMTKKCFTKHHLAQIKYLVPDFYNFEVQRVKNFANTAHKEAYELAIIPLFHCDIKIMNPTVLLTRRRYFQDALMKLVKKHHTQYLTNLNLPIVIPDVKLVRWHPGFDIDKIPEVQAAKLPEIPDVSKVSSAQDVLTKARDLFKCNTKMERAMKKLLTARQAKSVTEGTDKPKISNAIQTNDSNSPNGTILNAALRGLPASLLEKVKARQAAKALESMTRSNENEQKYLLYSRLPDLARTLRNIFVTERKNVLALNIILSKLGSSFKSNVPANELQKDLRLLSEEAPDWIKFHEIRNTVYLKLDKNVDLNNIIAKLDDMAKKYKFD